SGCKRGTQFAIHSVIGLAEVLAPLWMSYDHMSAARGLQHPGGNCAGISAIFFPEYVLAAHANAAVLNRLDHHGNVNKRRAEHDLIACMSPAQWQECGNKITRLL